MPPVRRLAAILAADVAGYSRLMGADEESLPRRPHHPRSSKKITPILGIWTFFKLASSVRIRHQPRSKGMSEGMSICRG